MGNKIVYIPYSNVFNVIFMKKYTTFNTIDEFLEKCGGIESNEDLETKIEEIELVVKSDTKFSSWEEMQTTAAKEYFDDKFTITFEKVLK